MLKNRKYRYVIELCVVQYHPLSVFFSTTVVCDSCCATILPSGILGCSIVHKLDDFRLGEMTNLLSGAYVYSDCMAY